MRFQYAGAGGKLYGSGLLIGQDDERAKSPDRLAATGQLVSHEPPHQSSINIQYPPSYFPVREVSSTSARLTILL